MLRNLDSPVRKRKVPQEIVYRIREQILSGALARGSKLPSEQELTENLNVSRQTLREALRVLEMQGLLEIRAGIGGGAFVAEVNEETAHMGLINFLHSKDLTLAHLTEVREIIEPHFAYRAAQCITEEQIAELEELQNRAKKEIAKKKSSALREIEISFHAKIACIGGNPILILISDFVEYLLRKAKQALQPDEVFSAAVIEAHDHIVAALKAHDPEAAARAMAFDVKAVGNALQKIADDNQRLTLREFN